MFTPSLSKPNRVNFVNNNKGVYMTKVKVSITLMLSQDELNELNIQATKADYETDSYLSNILYDTIYDLDILDENNDGSEFTLEIHN
jgi:hypothetical protein